MPLGTFWQLAGFDHDFPSNVAADQVLDVVGKIAVYGPPALSPRLEDILGNINAFSDCFWVSHNFYVLSVTIYVLSVQELSQLFLSHNFSAVFSCYLALFVILRMRMRPKKREHEKVLRTCISMLPLVYESGAAIAKRRGLSSFSDYVADLIRRDTGLDQRQRAEAA